MISFETQVFAFLADCFFFQVHLRNLFDLPCKTIWVMLPWWFYQFQVSVSRYPPKEFDQKGNQAFCSLTTFCLKTSLFGSIPAGILLVYWVPDVGCIPAVGIWFCRADLGSCKNLGRNGPKQDRCCHMSSGLNGSQLEHHKESYLFITW